MGDIVSLKQTRKDKAREEKEIRAAGNRVKFGQTKAEKQKTKIESNRAARDLDGHKRGE
jgi:hypothetical protein